MCNDGSYWLLLSTIASRLFDDPLSTSAVSYSPNVYL